MQNGGSQRAGGVDGRSREAQTDQVNERQRAADHQAGMLAVVELGVGYAEDRQNKHAGQHHFHKECGDIGPSVKFEAGKGHFLRKPCLNRVAAEGREIAKESAEQNGADERADHLRANIGNELVERHLFADEHGNGNGGVDMATRNVPDGIGHGHDYKAKGERGGNPVYAGHHGNAAGHENQNCRADTFGEGFFEQTHFLVLLFVFYIITRSETTVFALQTKIWKICIV